MIMESKVDVKGLEVLGAYEGLLDNVEIVGSDDKINFKAFLEGKKNTVAINNWKDKYIVYFKTNLTDNLTLIYHQRYSKYPFYNTIKDEQVNMIYNNINNTLYTIYYEYGQKVLELEGLKVLSIIEFGDSLENEINERIIKIVNNDVNNLNLSDEELEEYNKDILKDNENYCRYKQQAMELFVEGKNINFNSYARFEFGKSVYNIYDNGFKDCYVTLDGFNIIKAIYNKETYINERVNIILSEFKKSIYIDVFRNNKIAEFMEELKHDENLNIVRDVSLVLNNKDMKTLNITYKRNDEEMTFKIEGNPHISQNNKGFYINSYKICNGNDRAIFEKTFKEECYSADIYLLNIEKITYGRKVLYSK